MSQKIGVKAATIEQASGLVEAATGLIAEPRDSSFLGGDYFAFRSLDGAVLKLISNRDIYDNEPVVDGCDEWPIVLLLEGTERNSVVVQRLLEDKEHFVRVSGS